MPIEIRELVIRATIDQTMDKPTDRESGRDDNRKKDCCSDNLEMLLQMIKDKKER